MRHRGVTLTETLVACLLLSSLISLVSATLVRLDRQRLITEQSRIALDELSNQLDRLTGLPPEELPAALDAPPRLSAAAQRLPHVQLTVHRAPESSGVQIVASISWQSIGGQRVRPLTLAAWLSAPGDGTGAES